MQVSLDDSALKDNEPLHRVTNVLRNTAERQRTCKAFSVLSLLSPQLSSKSDGDRPRRAGAEGPQHARGRSLPLEDTRRTWAGAWAPTVPASPIRAEERKLPETALQKRPDISYTSKRTNYHDHEYSLL